MSKCSCGGVSISCPNGCGCFCTESPDCVRWCEPVVVEPLAGGKGLGEGGIVRTVKARDGSETILVNAKALEATAELPLHQSGTRLKGCLHGARLDSIALVLGALHGVSVTVPEGAASLTVDEDVDGTLYEIAERLGLMVA